MRIRLRRRRFGQVMIASAVLTALGSFAKRTLVRANPQPQLVTKPTATDTVDILLQVNSREYRLNIEPRVTLLDALREYIGLTGTKKGCNHGQCGACTVLVNGRRINSCLTLAVVHQGSQITTVEGLANGDELHPLQAAFIKHDAFQCGYCTPGQICSGVACIAEGHANSDDKVREWMSGNICRCGAYNGIVAAIREVAAQSKLGGTNAPV